MNMKKVLTTPQKKSSMKFGTKKKETKIITFIEDEDLSPMKPILKIKTSRVIRPKNIVLRSRDVIQWKSPEVRDAVTKAEVTRISAKDFQPKNFMIQFPDVVPESM